MTILIAVALAAALTVPHSRADEVGPLSVTQGFAVAPYADIGGVATSLAFGPDGGLFVADFAQGRILVIDDMGGIGGPPSVFASGFSSPLGVLVAPNGTVFVSDSEPSREGPFGNRPYGRVWRLNDTDGDGAADVRDIVLRDLPNGRHNTNGMALGPDGLLYVANGNSTDDGVEGGEPEAPPWSGSVVRIDPTATDVSLSTLGRRALVATGMRNLYDLAFSPVDPTKLFIPMNGADDPESDDLLYVTDVVGGSVDDFGFPSCLYNVAQQGNLEPYDNPNPAVIEAFGPCRVRRVPRPAASFGLHPSADGLEFQRTEAWGEEYRNDLFVAEFGNFFGSEIAGHRVVHVEFGADGATVTGFLSGVVPLDVTFDAAGDMYVADFSGLVYKVTKVA